MTKIPWKEIMLCSRPRSKQESKQIYNKQQNLCVTLLHKAKRNYFAV